MDLLQSLTIFGVLLACACAQRPFYAGGQYPTVLQQNLPAESEVGNRLGENTTLDPYVEKEKVPVYNVEKELVDRIKNEYPRDKQPFWYVNAAQINSFKYQQQQLQYQQQQLQVQQQQLQAQLDQVNDMLRRQQEINNRQQEVNSRPQEVSQQRQLKRSRGAWDVRTLVIFN